MDNAVFVGTPPLVARLAIAAILALGLCTEPISADPSNRARPTLLPDIGGPISRSVVSVNSARRAALRNAGLVSNIVNGLHDSSTFHVITNDLSAFVVESNRRPNRVQFIELPYDNPITIWTQDPFLVLTDNGETVLLKSRTFDRAGDSLMADRLAEELGLEAKVSELYFEGGNIVSDDESIFVGGNTIRMNASRLQIDDRDVVLRFQEELGRPVLVIGPVPQPVAHIDMMLTPLGGGRIALADPGHGARIIGNALRDDPETLGRFERQCEGDFYGHPSIEAIRGPDGQDIHAPELTGEARRMAEISEQLAPTLDGVAASLEEFGFRVYRIPFLFGGPESREDQIEESIQAAFPMLTYNNVLLEQRGSEERVYLPRFGLSTMDVAAESAWKRIGFEVRPIDGLTISAMYGGALRCSVKIIARSD